ncbi:MAG: ABC transporter permease [Chlamydiales bacterium]|nr:ABC transporter permease [Chlamydiales bacterium]
MIKNSLSNELVKQGRLGRYRRLKALIKKESLQIIRDPSSLLISVFLPLLLLFIYGFGVSLDINHLKLGLVLEDTAPDAQRFAKSLTDSTYLDVKIVRDQRALMDDLIRGSIRGFVVVPSYFSQFRHRQDVIAPIQVVGDGSEANTANFVQNYVQSAFQNWLVQEAITGNVKGLSLINMQPRYWYNEQLESRYFLLSGALAIIMTLIGALLTALVVAREWERGTMESMISTTVGIGELILGKVIPYFVLGMLSMGICVFITVCGFGLPLRGSLWLLALVSAVFLFCSLALGMMISTIAKNQIFAYQITLIVAFLPAYMLSGFLFEISSMPIWIQTLTYIIPAKYFVQCLQTLFLVGNIWSLIFFNMIPMIIIGVLFFTITTFKTVKRLE